ncbi:BRISC and BRCA1-A complex member 2-like isoform X2 [Zingiber officinale]|uniref:BRISC and BRCA1-A complex member 2-like isoform X2 n=1 Tax=Zingiber officinale TaxID=94328 RepID=UPI001C4AD29A|nr:BRISC and BRCA1-A complex member 2-like isoform X2 [Zingiber officinale]
MSVEPPLPQPIAAQLNHLLTYSPLSVKVERVWSGSKNARYSDRLTLSIPFCLDYIKWDVIYNALHPSLAPDVVFSLEDDDFDPLGDIAREGEMRLSKSSLCDWNGKDPSKLMALVHELRDLYTHYQRRRVGEIDDARLKFELNTMLSREGIEVCMVPSLDRPEEVKFSVRLIDTDLNKLVTSCNWKHQQKIYLQVIFPVSRSYSSAPAAPRIKLVSTPELKSLFSIEDVKLPQWCMAEYLPVIEDHLKVQVVEAIASIGARRRFIEALAPLFGRPLEVDPVFCRRATVLCGSGAFTFLVHFSIPTQFPKQQPILVMQSSQHFNSQSLPISSPPVNEYPWSPRWEPAEMAERIFEFVVDECLDFKKFCIDSSPK